MGHFTFISLCLMPMFLSLSGAECYNCPIDWLSRNGFCYKLFDDPKAWPDAEMFCRKHKPGCHLVSIHSTAESADLAEYVSDYLKSKKNVWIGLNDPEKNRIWEWTDRSSTNYSSWNEGEPNNSRNEEYCVHLLTLKGYHKWNDTPCKSLFSFICKCKF